MLVDPIAEGDKVKGEIVAVLLPHHIEQLVEDNKWYVAFGRACVFVRVSE